MPDHALAVAGPFRLDHEGHLWLARPGEDEDPRWSYEGHVEDVQFVLYPAEHRESLRTLERAWDAAQDTPDFHHADVLATYRATRGAIE